MSELTELCAGQLRLGGATAMCSVRKGIKKIRVKHLVRNPIKMERPERKEDLENLDPKSRVSESHLRFSRPKQNPTSSGQRAMSALTSDMSSVTPIT